MLTLVGNFCHSVTASFISLCAKYMTFPFWSYPWIDTSVISIACLVTQSGEGSGTPLQCSCLENPRDRLQSMGSLRVRHDWATSLSRFTFTHWRRKLQPTPVFLPGESQGWGSLVGCRLWGRRVGYDWSHLAAAAVTQSCPILCNPTDCSPPGSSVHEIL